MSIHNELINILLVDDRSENLEALAAVLNDPEYNVVKALSGAEALACLLKAEFAVILMDVQMPGMDGFETASLIHQRKLTRKIPIIFVTALDAECRYMYRGYEVGAVDYLIKPLDTHILRSKVAVFADLFRKNREILRQAELIRVAGEQWHATQLMNLEVQSLRRFRNLADAIPHMVWKSDPDGNLIYGNQVWASYTHSSGQPHEWPGWKDILHKDDRSAFVKKWEEGLSAKQPIEIVARLKGGPSRSYRWHLVKAVPEFEDGKVISWIGTNTDFDDRKKAEDQLAESASELTRSNAELEQFAYVASHDLQEPLRMVASYAQLLDRRYQGKLDADGDKFIAYIVDGATRMQALISDLLTFSRVGKGNLSVVETDLNDEIARVLTDLKEAMVASGGRVTYDPLPSVVASPSKIFQLFLNLIGNAIKFRRSEPPRVHISVTESASEWVFSVQDNGIGIEPQYFERIFVIFQRLHGRQEYPGTGMGLAICRKIVERHHGRIWVESQPGSGSNFIFTISKHLGKVRPSSEEEPDAIPEKELKYG